MYTPEEEALLKEKYDGTVGSVQDLVKELNKSTRSVIGKLSKMGIYKKATYKSKTDETPITKLELRAMIEEKLSTDLPGLEKSPKDTLKHLFHALNK